MSYVMSMEFENTCIRIAEGKKVGKSLTKIRYISLSIPENTIDDGKILNLDKVKEVIEKAFKENEIRASKSVFLINSNAVFIRKIELPILKCKKETLSMLRYELAHMSPAKNNYAIFYKKAAVKSSCSLNKAEYIVYAVPDYIFDQYLKLAEMLKLNAVSIDLAANSLEKLEVCTLSVNNKEVNKHDAVGFLYIGLSNITFSIIHECVNKFSKISGYGLSSLIDSFISDFDFTLDEAKKELDDLSLIEDDTNLWENEKVNITREFLCVRVNEIGRLIRYYNSIYKDKQISKIYVYGFTRIEGLKQYLSYNLNNDFELIGEAAGIDNIDTMFLNTVLSLYVNYSDVNFLYEKNKSHKIKFAFFIAALFISLIIILNSLCSFCSSVYKNNSSAQEIETMNIFVKNEDNINLYKQAVKAEAEEKYMYDSLNAAIKIKEYAETENVVSSELIKTLFISLPHSSYIKYLVINDKSIQLKCLSCSMKDVSEVIKNIRNIDAVENVKIPSILMREESDGNIYEYSLVCVLKGAFYESE